MGSKGVKWFNIFWVAYIRGGVECHTYCFISFIPVCTRLNHIVPYVKGINSNVPPVQGRASISSRCGMSKTPFGVAQIVIQSELVML